jgi:DNA-binding IclR family transcriptional regulator
MSTIGLSAPAAYVLRSLLEHPRRGTAAEIADGAPADQGLDEAAARGALQELSDRGLAVQGTDGRWQTTGAPG